MNFVRTPWSLDIADTSSKQEACHMDFEMGQILGQSRITQKPFATLSWVSRISLL